METLEELHNKLFDIYNKRDSLLVNHVRKTDPGYKQLNTEQRAIEQNINKFKADRKKNKLEKKTISKEEVTKPLPDDYTGIRCEYCGGETIDGICINKSEDWPHE